jgi:serine/threonine-protein kinase
VTATVLQPAGPTQTSGPAVPGYRLVRKLGEGGMGVVYLAVREADGAEVAVKTVLPAMAGSDAQVRRFLREADILKHLDHPRIVRYFDVGAANGVLYFVMEYARGTDAAKVLKERGPLPVRAALRVACQVLEGLAHAHERGFVHRDVKPANVLLEGEAGNRRVKLADFGLARVYQASQLSGLTVTGDIGGTPAYLPPEQITNYRGVAPAADQYSTAAMLYHLLTRKHVHDPQPMPGMLMAILEQEPMPIQTHVPDISNALAATIHRALAKNPKERFRDANSFRKALLVHAE